MFRFLRLSSVASTGVTKGVWHCILALTHDASRWYARVPISASEQGDTLDEHEKVRRDVILSEKIRMFVTLYDGLECQIDHRASFFRTPPI
jgi:hypothetical protein